MTWIRIELNIEMAIVLVQWVHLLRCWFLTLNPMRVKITASSFIYLCCFVPCALRNLFKSFI